MKKSTIILTILLIAAVVCAGVFGVQKGDLDKKISDLTAQVTDLTSKVKAAETEAGDSKSLAETAQAALESLQGEYETVKAALEEALAKAAETAEEAAEAVEETLTDAEEAVADTVEAATEAVEETVAAVAAAVEGTATDVTLGKVKIAVPDDPTNEGRALLLLQANGVLTLAEDAGITATKNDVLSTNGVEIEFVEMEAALVPTVLTDVDYAIINNNYALDAGIDPVKDSLLIESAESPYVNVVCVKEGNEDSDAAKALAAAVLSQQIADYINNTYGGSAVSTVAEPTDGYDDSVDYEALAGTTISIGCSPVPHAEILAIAKDILAAKNITLEIVELSDYVTPNNMVEDGDLFANYFAHQPYQDDFNEKNGTHIVTIAGIHVEPMGLYGGQQTDLAALGVAAE